MTAFFDSNILIYAVSTDRRRPLAIKALADGGTISVQVLNEFTNVLRKKQQLDWPVIERAVAAIRKRFPVILPVTADTHAAGLMLAREHGLSFYDALIVASAIEAGCRILWTEDMQHGRTIAGLTIRDPFDGMGR